VANESLGKTFGLSHKQITKLVNFAPTALSQDKVLQHQTWLIRPVTHLNGRTPQIRSGTRPSVTALSSRTSPCHTVNPHKTLITSLMQERVRSQTEPYTTSVQTAGVTAAKPITRN
jgi:hypothetical protein